jgi:hypothetical protein
MKFFSEATKLLTNKYFLYFMVFLTATNVLGYLVTNKMNAVIFFALVSLLTYQFSKNMAVVLLVAVITTNFLMANKHIREGLENKSVPALENIADKDPQIAETIPAVKKAKTNEEVKAEIAVRGKKDVGPTSTKIVDTNNSDLNQSSDDGEVQGFDGKLGGKKANKSEPRLDYAATIEESYANLDNVLGSNSIKQLTNDTQKLMQQQQNLFNTMNQMVPVLEGAQNMLKNFDMGSISKSLESMSSIANPPNTKPSK